MAASNGDFFSLTFHRKNVILLHTNVPSSSAELTGLISCFQSHGFGTVKEKKETMCLKGEHFSRIGIQNDNKLYMYYNTVSTVLPFHRRIGTMIAMSRLFSSLAGIGWRATQHSVFNINEFQQQGTVFFRKTSPQSELLFAFTCDDSFERVVAIPSQLFTPDIPRKLEKQLRKISRPASAQAAVPVQVQVREEEGFQLINILVGGSESLDTSVENYLSILRVLGEDGWKVGTSVAPFGTKVDGVMLHKDIQNHHSRISSQPSLLWALTVAPSSPPPSFSPNATASAPIHEKAFQLFHCPRGVRALIDSVLSENLILKKGSSGSVSVGHDCWQKKSRQGKRILMAVLSRLFQEGFRVVLSLSGLHKNSVLVFRKSSSSSSHSSDLSPEPSMIALTIVSNKKLQPDFSERSFYSRNTPYSVSVQNSIDAISRSSGNFESYEKVFRYPEFTFCSPASNGPRKKQISGRLFEVLLKILGELSASGWRLAVSANISGMESGRIGNKAMVCPHTWVFVQTTTTRPLSTVNGEGSRSRRTRHEAQQRELAANSEAQRSSRVSAEQLTAATNGTVCACAHMRTGLRPDFPPKYDDVVK